MSTHAYGMRLLLLLAGLCFALAAFGQDEEIEALQNWPSGRYMVQAVGAMAEKAEQAAKGTDFGLEEGAFCLFGAYLKVGKTVKLVRELEKGVPYLFVGGGDSDALQVDLLINDATGKIVASATTGGRAPVVRYTSPKGGPHGITLRLSKSRIPRGPTGSFCSLGILRKGGLSLDDHDAGTGLGKCLAAGLLVKERLGLKVTFHDVPNQWSMFGGVMAEEAPLSISNLSLEQGTHFFVSAAEDGVEELDLVLQDADGNEMTSQNAETANLPYFVTDTDAGNQYRLKFTNKASDNDAAFVVGVVMDLEEQKAP